MIEGRAMGAMGANCYLFACMDTKKAVVIDPGADAKRIYRWVLEKGLKVEYILLTHGHVDHIGAVDELKELLGDVLVGIHADDAGMLTDGRKNLSSYFGPGLVLNKADLLLQDGQELMIGKERLKVISTPGHSPGGACFLCSEGLFVKKKLLILPEDTRVFPGHGEETSIGEEKRDNPFLE
ncbi:MAG: Zn-dependent hydrolase, glyoxylase [Firmicutes bacterium]|nr:Zn-dependent hydrolase, glyoxylase [Bacillota bacterium]